MNDDSDILELKFEGNGIKPNIVKPSEIAFQIEQFETALLSTIKDKNPVIDIEQVLFYFDSIKNESISINFLAKNKSIDIDLKSAIITAYLLVTTCINTGDFSDLTNDAIGALKGIAKFSKKHNCNAYFRHNGESLSTITPTSEIKAAKIPYLKGDITIYGTLYDAGGENPNIHLKVNNQYPIIIETTKEAAKLLAQRLYDYVGLKGVGKWDAKTSEVKEFKLYNILDYKSGNEQLAFAEISKITSGGWDKYNSDAEINNRLQRD